VPGGSFGLPGSQVRVRRWWPEANTASPGPILSSARFHELHSFAFITPVAAAATSGALLGTFLAMRSPARGLRQLLMSSGASAASLGMLGLSFSAAREYTRNVTGSESPVNSAVGGAAAGGLLFASHGGNPVFGAALVAALSALADAVLSPTVQGTEARDMVGPEPSGAPGGAEGSDGTGGHSDGACAGDRGASWWSLERWVRKTSEEERREFLEKVRLCHPYSALRAVHQAI